MCIKGVGLVFAEVPGPQTVPRAEVWAPVVSLQALNLRTPLNKWDTDAQYVVSNSLKLAQHEEAHPTKGPLAGAHGDIWSKVKHLLVQGAVPLPTKVISHVNPELIGDAIAVEEYFLNGIADALASKAAERFALPLQVCANVENNISTAFFSVHASRCS